MDVTLYVYDLSQGLARQFSQQFLGRQIDAVYHTSIVLDGIEYFFGAGIQSCAAGTSHHGRPMETIPLGRTELPFELIVEYVSSLGSTYSAESYDLFLHNCNNFSNDFAMFLVGRGIPSHITALPETVLNTPFGQMLRPALDRSMRSITQAPLPGQNGTPSVASRAQIHSSSSAARVRNISRLTDLEAILRSAERSCAVIFFTSATCPPCRLLYQPYDELAEEAGDKAILIKVDTSSSYEIAAKYDVRATPTIMTFLKGEKQESWSGADVVRLRTAVKLLIQMAHPPHQHSQMGLSRLHERASRPVKFAKVPTLDKLVERLGPRGGDDIVQPARKFISLLNETTAQDNPLPDLPALGNFFKRCVDDLPPDCVFAAYDLFRLFLIDSRVCAFYAESDRSHAFQYLLCHTNKLGDSAPYNLRIVTLRLACNILCSPLSRHVVLEQRSLVKELIQLTTSNLLDSSQTNTRVAASSLCFNIAVANYKHRTENQKELLEQEDQVEIGAAIIEMLEKEEDKDVVVGLATALGLLVFQAPMEESELLDLCRAMDVATMLPRKAAVAGEDEGFREAQVLMEKGL